MYGYSFDRPARHMREYLSVLLPLLDGTAVSVDGSTLSAHIGLSVPRAGRVPVLLAALAPRMLALAGEQTDGTVLWMTGPATVRDYVVPAISAAAGAAGRSSPRIVCSLPVCVTGDPAAARASADKELAIYGQLPSYRAMLDREGAAGPGDVAIVGDEDAVAAQIAELADAGVTDFTAAAVRSRPRPGTDPQPAEDTHRRKLAPAPPTSGRRPPPRPQSAHRRPRDRLVMAEHPG